MNPETKKLVLPLLPEQLCSKPVPLKMIYVLQSPRESWRRQGIRLMSLDRRQAFLELLKNTFNYLHVPPDLLQRQFNEASSLANSHSRVAGNLSAVRYATLADVCNPHEEAAWGA